MQASAACKWRPHAVACRYGAGAQRARCTPPRRSRSPPGLCLGVLSRGMCHEAIGVLQGECLRWQLCMLALLGQICFANRSGSWREARWTAHAGIFCVWQYTIIYANVDMP